MKNYKIITLGIIVLTMYIIIIILIAEPKILSNMFYIFKAWIIDIYKKGYIQPILI